MIEDMDVKTASEINNLEPTQFVDVTNHGRNFLYSSNYVAPEASMGMIVLGRRTEQQRETNDVNFDNNAVSRRHAQIERKMITDENGKWIRTGLVVTDLDSKNGTFINGERLQPRVAKEAPEGSIIELGTIKGEAFIVRNCNLVPYADFYQKRKEKVESLKATDKYKAEIELPKAEVQLQEANRELARLRALETNRTIIEIAVNQIAEQITIDNVESYLLGETILLDPTHRIPFERSILPQGKTEITLGVLPENDYQLVGPRSEEISRRHAIIRRSSNRLFIEDTSSLNGTYVNGNDIRGSGQIELQEGAVKSL
jgi:pSer/pThr/pTyr-binding forkhead associated (FHA) protein